MMNLKNNKKKIKTIKKLLIEQNQFKKYKESLKTKKIFFMISKLLLIFNNEIDEKQLCKWEEILMNKPNDINTWESIFKQGSKYVIKEFENCKWESFGKFLYYIYNQYLFNDKKLRSLSIYTYDNFNEHNKIKSNEYNNWLKSIIETKKIDFNLYIRGVLKTIW